jgi:Ca2+-binding EF-hand superfamily protein
MGCACSRDPSETIENKFFLPFERNLGFEKSEFEHFDDTFRRFSRSGFLTSKQLEKTLEACKIPYQPFSEFYDMFVEKTIENNALVYSASLIKILGLFLSKSDLEKKILILYSNYDIRAAKMLSKEFILEILQDMLTVAIDTFSAFMLKQYVLDEDLKYYVKCILERKNNLLEEYFTKITENQPEV